MVLILNGHYFMDYKGQPITVIPHNIELSKWRLYIENEWVTTYDTLEIAMEEATAIIDMYSEPYYVQTQKDYDYIDELRKEYDEYQDEDYQD